MPTVRDLLIITDRFSVELLAPHELQASSSRPITRVVILQNITALRTVPENSLVLVPAGLFTRQDSSGIDILIRRVAERAGVGVLVQGLLHAAPRVERLASRFDIAVLGCPENVDLGDLVTALNHALSGGPADVLVRAWKALDSVARWEQQEDADPADLMSDVRDIIGEPQLRIEANLPYGAPIIVNGREFARIGTGTDADLTPELRIVRPALQNAISARLMNTQLRHRIVRDEQARALAVLIVADANTVEHYATLARRIGVDVDGHHCAVTVKSPSEIGRAHV